MNLTSQEIYQSLLNSDLTPLQKFKSNKTAIIYPDALKYPSFFDHNLLSPGRVIKKIKGKSALLRSFGYQLMKLVFQIQVLEIDYIYIFKKIVFSPALTYQSDVQSPISGQAYTDKQYKRILADFIQIMIRQNIPSFQLTIMTYPIIEEALVRILGLLIINECPLEQTSEDLLEWLCNKFHITMHRYGMCYKFEESDIFLYQQNEQQFYIAFLNEMAEVSDYSESTNRLDLMSPDNLKNNYEEEQDQNFKNSNSDIMPSQHEKELDIYPSDKFRYSVQVNKKPLPNFAYHQTIDNHKIFLKQLNGEQNDDNYNDKPDNKSSKIGSLLDMLSDKSREEISQKFKTPQSITQRHSQQPVANNIKISNNLQTPQFNTKLYIEGHDNYNPFTNKYSDHYIGNIYQKNVTFADLSNNQNTNFLTHNYQYKYYQPKEHYQSLNNNNNNLNRYDYYQYKNTFNINPSSSSLNNHYEKFNSYKNNLVYQQVVEVNNHQQDLFYNPNKINKPMDRIQKYGVIKKKYNFDEKEDESKGTLYKQFTDTKILDMVTSFQRFKIKNIKQRYRGVHRKNNKAFF